MPALVAALAVPPVSRAGAGAATVSPGQAEIDTLGRFTVAGDADQSVYDVAFNGQFVGQVLGDPDTGAYQGTLPVPGPDQPGAALCGTNTVTVRHVETGAVLDTGTLVGLCSGLRVTPAETSGVRSTSYTLVPSDAVRISFNELRVDGVVQPFQQPQIGQYAFTASLDCGVHQVRLIERLSGEFGSTFVAAFRSGTTQVWCPAVAVAPAAVRSPDQPVTVTVTATGFHGGRTVDVRLDGSPAASGVSDGTGRFTAPLRVAGLACGDHTVTVSERPVLSRVVPLLLTAGAPLTVNGCGSTPTPAGGAAIQLDPTVVRTGTLTHVTGAGFTAGGGPVTLTWRAPDGTTLPGECSATADAAGRIDTYCLVLPHGLLGARQLVATQGTRSATADAVVGGGTMQPAAATDQLVFRR